MGATLVVDQGDTYLVTLYNLETEEKKIISVPKPSDANMVGNYFKTTEIIRKPGNTINEIDIANKQQVTFNANIGIRYSVLDPNTPDFQKQPFNVFSEITLYTKYQTSYINFTNGSYYSNKRINLGIAISVIPAVKLTKNIDLEIPITLNIGNTFFDNSEYLHLLKGKEIQMPIVQINKFNPELFWKFGSNIFINNFGIGIEYVPFYKYFGGKLIFRI